MDLVFNFNLTQIVSGPTHCAGNTLDIALANFDTLCHIDTYKNVPADLSSDHNIIVCSIEESIGRHVKTLITTMQTGTISTNFFINVTSL